MLEPLRQAGIPYMVTGGLAAIIYGEPRLTNDVDIVVQLKPADAEGLATLWLDRLGLAAEWDRATAFG